MKNTQLALLFVAAAALAALAWFLLAGPSDGPAGLAGDPAVESAPPPRDAGPVVLAAGEPVEAPQAAEPSAAPQASAPASAADRREALDGGLDGRTWADLLRPVDGTTGAPVEDAFVVHVDAKGVRREHALDAPLRDGDLDEHALAAVDGPQHCPRAFVPAELAARADGPLEVALHPAGSLVVQVEGEAPEPLPKLALEVGPSDVLGDVLRNDPRLAELGFDGFEEVQPILAFARTLQLLLSERSDERFRRRQVRWALRTDAVRPLLDPAGAPFTTAVAGTVVQDPTSFPAVVRDLPLGVEVSVSVESESIVELWDADEETWSSWSSGALTIDRERPAVVRLRFPGEARVRGRLPAPAGDPRLVLRRDSGDEDLWNVPSAEVDDDGAFLFERVRPGRLRLVGSWREADDSIAHAQRTFDLVAGQDLDLGLLLPEGDGTLTIVPRLLVDGVEDPGLLGGALLEVPWTGWLARYEGADGGGGAVVLESTTDVSLDAAGFEPLVVRGLAAGEYSLTVWGAELPDDVAARYRVDGWEHEDFLSIAGDTTVEVVLSLSGATSCAIRAQVPASDHGYTMNVSALAFDPTTGEVREVDVENGWQFETSEPWTVEAQALLDPGTWQVVVVVTPETDFAFGLDRTEDVPEERLTGYVGRTTVTVVRGVANVVDVPLGPAATLRGPASAFNPELKGPDGEVFSFGDWVRLFPVGWPEGTSGPWETFGADEDGDVTIRGLLPDTDYAVPVFDPFAALEGEQPEPRVLRSGPPGSVVDVVP